MNTESEILKLRDQIVSAASAYYYAVEDTLKESGYSLSYIDEQRDRIHHALLWMMRDDLIVVDGDTHQGTANLVWSFSSRPLYFIHDVFGPFLYLGYGGQVCVLYESSFPTSSNVSWITGAGMSLFKSIDSYPDSPAFKSGISAVMGIEWKFKIPLSIRLDTRQGYGVLFAPVRNPKTKNVSSVDHSWHFFDYAFVLSLYYHFR